MSEKLKAEESGFYSEDPWHYIIKALTPEAAREFREELRQTREYYAKQGKNGIK